MADDRGRVADLTEVARLFDSMGESYDDVSDLWYSHLFDTISSLLKQCAEKPIFSRQLQALDIGCGTGMQAAVLSHLGYRVVGVDISPGLVRRAQAKLPTCEFVLGDAQHLPFGDSTFDLINCCGSTLSFIPDYKAALREAARVLRRGGSLFLEVEQKWNPDLFWSLLNSVTFNFLGYNESLAEWLNNIKRPLKQGFFIDYPFPMSDGTVETMKIRLFTKYEVNQELLGNGIGVTALWSIHTVTNLLPSMILHNEDPSRPLRSVFSILAKIDDATRHLPFFRSFGCSLVLRGVKTR